MADRNHQFIKQVVKSLGSLVRDEEAATRVLEHHFQDHLVINAGGVEQVGVFARALRLRITPEERGEVLDYIGEQEMVGITIDHVEQAINEKFGEDRFIEP